MPAETSQSECLKTPTNRTMHKKIPWKLKNHRGTDTAWKTEPPPNKRLHTVHIIHWCKSPEQNVGRSCEPKKMSHTVCIYKSSIKSTRTHFPFWQLTDSFEVPSGAGGVFTHKPLPIEQKVHRSNLAAKPAGTHHFCSLIQRKCKLRSYRQWRKRSRVLKRMAFKSFFFSPSQMTNIWQRQTCTCGQRHHAKTHTGLHGRRTTHTNKAKNNKYREWELFVCGTQTFS